MKLLTFSEARKLVFPVVYGLHDSTGLFYIGSTFNPKMRFFVQYYLKRQVNVHLLRRIRGAGPNLRVEILVENPPDLRRSEADMIAKLSPELCNIAANPYRLKSGFSVSMKACAPTEAAICAGCDGPLSGKNSKYCFTCVGKLTGKTGSTKDELRKLLSDLKATGQIPA